ncbi:signal recognition particle-docking protein FtsY [Hydrocarboniclastica marina]|uniref:Signal recognition particle receptor FtsY n=1 Tax=Hydrocarboniclastica marina TaxID=2259620 RepID=A0A4V1D8C5_9ALTE|nr:signal recognition particle-docking protein FtsY [Hydrocarboniclastica marina]MAL98833.1 signal recognition particle-docking protein FtsY [Alteromonadaceae bacterium]QCF24710.1 signal recognition particle-docking protein FtsY [Hydrocarboniclastica marina]
MTLEQWLDIGILALLVLVFVFDLISRRSVIPKPVPVPQRELERKPDEQAELERQPEPDQREAVPEQREVVPAAEKPPVPVEPPQPPVAVEPPEQVSVFQRIRQGLGKTRAGFAESLSGLFRGRKSIDDELLEDIETLLLTADVGMTATTEIIDSLTQKLERNQLNDADELHAALKKELRDLLEPSSESLELDSGKKPYIILMVGVNGVGKTTTIGKLAKRFQGQGKSVLLAAGDTFRAAAVEQLQVWGERNNVPVIAQEKGADSASVIFDAIQAGQSRGADVVIADTAGRLQNKDNLMSELQKVVRVMKKLDESAPHEVMLVLDAGTGQNALSQAQVFQQAVGVTGITLTKLDGTAKGGIIFAIARQLKLPIRFIGVGEQVDDLRPFEAEEFVQALFD